MFDRMMRAARLDRRLYTEVFFDNAATGDAVLIVAGIYGAIYLALVLGSNLGFSVVSFIGILLSGLIGWLIVSGGLWLAGTKIFEGSARGATVIRLTGFTHVPLVLLLAAPFVGSILTDVVVAAALIWFIAAISAAARVLFDFDTRKSVGSALLAVALWWVVQSIGIGDGLASLIRFF
ncbi:MAG TPA: YIP1 family protein [Acidimicrobiia bacterium]|nr:YIP1 family protein [Acidimicrobiia bacterium]